MNQKKIGNKKSVKDEIEKLKQRREERKIREDKKGQIVNQMQDSNKLMDIEYEKMILKKQSEIYSNEPKKVKINKHI